MVVHLIDFCPTFSMNTKIVFSQCVVYTNAMNVIIIKTFQCPKLQIQHRNDTRQTQSLISSKFSNYSELIKLNLTFPFRIMVVMEGQTAMYMRMPMSSSKLPVVGKCKVDGRRVTLSFPFTGIEFDLPTTPSERANDYDFRIRGTMGDMAMTIGYVPELKCYHGIGRIDDDTHPALTFTFYSEDSPMNKLPGC